MSPGESKTVHIPADEAYGPKTPENTHPLAGEDLNFEITLLEILVVSADNDPALGPENAPVTIIQFSDFQCPFSKRYFDETEQLILSAYGDQVRYVFRDFPLTSIHPQAEKAAEAARCAFDQGKFWEYHDMLFQNQGALDVDSLKSYAAALGLDQTAFNLCLNSGKYAEEVEKDIEDARSYGVTGSPTLFINGRKVVGAQPYAVFQNIIEEELAKIPGQ
jgi:protein-disulfide isomerase